MATNIPDPINTPHGPAYEGRLLDRPADEVVDQGAPFDIDTLLSRRLFIGAGLAGIGSLALAACTPGSASSNSSTSQSRASSTTATTTTSSASMEEIPDETAGPYPGDGSNGPDVLEESGIVRRDIRSSIGADSPVEGVPLEFTLTITDIAHGNVPFEGVAVYAWHCDGQGQYSMYSSGVENETWLRGVQIADEDGEVTFTSIVPGCYAGRWTHIHFEVYPDAASISDANNAIAISQLAIPEEALTPVYELAAYEGSAQNLSNITLDSDNVFGDDGGELQLATITGDATTGYFASLAVGVDTTTEVSAGAAPGGGAGGPGSQPPAGGQPPAMPGTTN